MSKWFQRFALLSADVVGRPVAFLLACLTILVWGGLGPIMKFSDTWQLIIRGAARAELGHARDPAQARRTAPRYRRRAVKRAGSPYARSKFSRKPS